MKIADIRNFLSELRAKRAFVVCYCNFSKGNLEI